jgi:hypothetical protein
VTELWNWRIDGHVPAERIRALLIDLLGRPVVPIGRLGPAGPPPGLVLCDVWYVPGAYPTAVSCYGPPEGAAELNVLAACARRLGRHCLLADDTLDPGRHLLFAPEGTIRPVHLDVADTEEGEVLSRPRPCTAASPRCRGWSPCQHSRWAPDSILPVLAAA